MLILPGSRPGHHAPWLRRGFGLQPWWPVPHPRPLVVAAGKNVLNLGLAAGNAAAGAAFLGSGVADAGTGVAALCECTCPGRGWPPLVHLSSLQALQLQLGLGTRCQVPAVPETCLPRLLPGHVCFRPRLFNRASALSLSLACSCHHRPGGRAGRPHDGVHRRRRHAGGDHPAELVQARQRAGRACRSGAQTGCACRIGRVLLHSVHRFAEPRRTLMSVPACLPSCFFSPRCFCSRDVRRRS